MAMTRRSTSRRMLASLMLASMALFLVTPLLAATVVPSGDCPLAPTGRGPVLAAGMDGAPCEHVEAGPCVVALGCVGVPPVIRPASVLLVNASRMILAGAASIPHADGLFRSRPPTPPPNQS